MVGMDNMADTYDESVESESRAASLFMTVGAFALYLFATAGLPTDRLGALAAGDLHTWGLAVLLLAPLVAFAALGAR
jgi:hypothetical protein